VRINGGTNIAAAIARAGSMMKADDQSVSAASDAPTHTDNPSTAGSLGHTGTTSTDAGALGGGGSGSLSSFEGATAASGAAAEEAGVSLLLPATRPARLVMLLTDGRVDSYQVLAGGWVGGWVGR
jgi:hypothetical protein